MNVRSGVLEIAENDSSVLLNHNQPRSGFPSDGLRHLQLVQMVQHHESRVVLTQYISNAAYYFIKQRNVSS